MSLSLRLLKRAAKKSQHRRYHHSALIFSGSKLLASGYNVDGTHAEVMAIRRFKRIYKRGRDHRNPPNNLHLISFMEHKRGDTIGNSCPCPNCFDAIRKSSIKKITYFGADGKPCQVTLNA